MSIGVRVVVGALVGAVAGYAIYRFVGCRTGACPLQSNPFVSMALWGLMGAMIGGGK